MNYQSPTYTIYQLLEIFPTAKPYVRRKTKKEITELKQQLRDRLLIERECAKIISKTYRDRWFFQMVADILIIPNKAEIEKKIKRNYFLLSALKPKKVEDVKSSKITEEDIMKAKERLLTDFLEINKS